MLSLGSSLTLANAAAALREALPRVNAGETTVDCSRLDHVDSAAVAVLLALHRAAQARSQPLSVVGAPSQLVSLAALYGVGELLALDGTSARH